MMLVSRESEAGNWKDIAHFSFHCGTDPFFCLPLVAEAVEGRAVPPLGFHSTGQSSFVGGEESCPGAPWFCACCSSCRVGVLCAHLCWGHTLCKPWEQLLPGMSNTSLSLGGEPAMPALTSISMVRAALKLWAGRCHCGTAATSYLAGSAVCEQTEQMASLL